MHLTESLYRLAFFVFKSRQYLIYFMISLRHMFLNKQMMVL